MADVGIRGAAGSDRGQLILVTGLIIAVTMVALVLLLNTAIYTENLASRGADQSGREAIEYRGTVVEGVAGLIEAENAQGYDDYTKVWRSVRDGVVQIDNRTSRSYALGGTVVRINRSAMDIHNGTAMRQTSEQAFESNSGDTDWTLITGVKETRSFSMTVTSDNNLIPTNETMVVQDRAFNVTLKDEDGHRWQVYVYANETSGDDIAVAVRIGGGSAQEIWSDDGDDARIDLNKHTINDQSVSELNWSDDITDPHEIAFSNGDEANGRYNITVKSASVEKSDFNDVGDSPYYVAIVYSVDLPLHYESPTLTYETTVRVAPGEPE